MTLVGINDIFKTLILQQFFFGLQQYHSTHCKTIKVNNNDYYYVKRFNEVFNFIIFVNQRHITTKKADRQYLKVLK